MAELFSIEFLLIQYKEAMVEYSRLQDAKWEAEKQIPIAAVKANEARFALFKAAGL